MSKSPKGQPMFDKIALIGIGLIGGSIALEAGKRGLAKTIVAATRSAETAALATKLKLADHCGTDLAAACDGADLVIVCTPVGAVGAVAKTIAPKLKKGCIVSDVGSVKQAVIDAMRPHIPAGVHFVPAHPVAGTEYSGPDAGFAELFVKRWCILTPPENLEWEDITRHICAGVTPLARQAARTAPEETPT